MTQWLWTCVGTGAEATVFWCFNQRSGGFEGGEWGLLGVDGKPSPRLEASQAVSEAISRHQTIFDQACHPDCRVAIVIDEASEMLALIDGCSDDFADARNRQAYMQGVCGAWMWAHDMGHEVTFLHHDQLVARQDQAFDLILVPTLLPSVARPCLRWPPIATKAVR